MFLHASQHHSSWRTLALRLLLTVVTLAGCLILARYLRNQHTVVTAVFLAAVAAALHVPCVNAVRLPRRHYAWMLLFAGIFALSIVAGYHLIIPGVNEHIDRAYVTAFTWKDPLAWLAITAYLEVICSAGLRLIALLQTKLASRMAQKADEKSLEVGVAIDAPAPAHVLSTPSWRLAVIAALIMLVLWLPWLLAWWPGIIFNDSLSSIFQASGIIPYSNHHPFLYTIFIKVCLKLAHVFGLSNTEGCAIYTFIQMMLMAGTFGYTFTWLATRLTSKRTVRAVIALALALLFGLLSPIPSYAIAMWKDPLFSTALLLLTVLLAEFLLSRGAAAHKRSWRITFILSALAACFLRNNGIYILVALFLCFAGAALYQYRHKPATAPTNPQQRKHLRPAAIAAVLAVSVIAVSSIVQGPVYKALGITSSGKEEMLGIPLNQVARVAATGGVLTDEQAAYLDELFPLEEYASTYTPGLTDTLKWDDRFNVSAFDWRFVRVWFEVGLQNPIAYLESWALQTCGFWAVNQPELVANTPTITIGDMANGATGLNEWFNIKEVDIEASAPAEGLPATLFAVDQFPLAVAPIFWLVLYLSVALILLNGIATVLPYVPAIAMMGTLLIATPIAYWARYAALLQFAWPLYLAWPFMLPPANRHRTPASHH
jgi:hypothetical protein